MMEYRHMRRHIFLLAFSLLSGLAMAQGGYGTDSGFNPESPEIPCPNGFYPEKGLMVLDGIRHADLGGAIDNILKASMAEGVSYDEEYQAKADLVRSLVICADLGREESDYGPDLYSVGYMFRNLRELDMSKTCGYSMLYTMSDVKSVEVLHLPDCLEGIGSLSYNTRLTDVYSLAELPPAYDIESEYGDPLFADGTAVTVHVPEQSVDLYRAAEGWKDAQIVAMESGVGRIRVNMPAGTDMKDYRNLSLVLMDEKSGLSTRYVTQDRDYYLFPGLQDVASTTWSVTLYSRLGAVVASVGGIEAASGTTAVTLPALKPVMVGSVRLKSGVSMGMHQSGDLNGLVDATWYDMKGTRLTSGYELAGMVSGDRAKVELKVKNGIWYNYQQPPQWIELTAGDSSADTVLYLNELRTYQLMGHVRESGSGRPVKGVVVKSFSQDGDGTLRFTTDGRSESDGFFYVYVYEGTAVLSFEAEDHTCADVILDTRSFKEASVSLDDIFMKTAVSRKVVLNLSFTGSVPDGQTALHADEFYARYNDIRYEVCNMTTGRQLTGFSVIYPDMIFNEGVGDDDVLQVTLISDNGDFDNVVRTVALRDGSGTLDVGLVQRGGIQAAIRNTGSGTVAAVLYDSDGNLQDRYFYTQGSLTVQKLPAGQYTMVTMYNDPALTRLPTLDSFYEMGMEAGRDYVVNSVTVGPGIYSQVKIEEVPALDADMFKILHPSSTFSVSAPTVLEGEYVTVRSRILLKNTYATSWQYDGYQLVFDLPAGCSYLKNSLLVDGVPAQCEISNCRMTVKGIDRALENAQTVDVRFCIVPKFAAGFNVAAKLTYNYEGEPYSSPVGTASFVAATLEYDIPSFSSDGRVSVTGTAAQGSTVTLYDNGRAIGQTVVAGKFWAMNEQLSDTTNLSIHPLSVRCETKEGNVYTSTVTNLMVDKDMNRVSKVTMYYPNAWSGSTEVCTFDFINPTDEETYDYYPDSKDFTFVIDFLRNDPEEIGTVLLFIDLADGETLIKDAHYSSSRKAWTVNCTLAGNQAAPENVRVSYDLLKASVHADRLQLDAPVAELNEFIAEINSLVEMLAGCTEDNIDDVMKAYENAVGYSLTAEPAAELDEWERWLDTLSPEEREAEFDRILEETDLLLDSIAQRSANVLAGIPADGFMDLELDDGSRMKVTDCSAYDEGTMLERGFTAQAVNDGSNLYILEDSVHSVVVDFKAGRAVQIDYAPGSAMTRGVIDICVNGRAQVKDLVDIAKSALDKLLGAVAKSTEEILMDMSGLLTKQSQLEIMLRRDDVGVLQKAAAKASLYKTKLNIMSTDALLKVAGKVPGVIKKLIPVVSYIQLASEFIDKFNEIESTYRAIPQPCPKDQEAADAIAESLDLGAGLLIAFCTGKLALQISTDIATAASVAGAVPTGGLSALAGAAVYVAKTAALMVADWAFAKSNDVRVAQARAAIGRLKCKKTQDYDIPNNPAIPPDRPPYPDPVEPRPRRKRALIDPSGFVCEAVESNRLEGVTATCYYKTQIEDMYGETVEQVVLWDAENYGQQNPLLTDAQGMYSWMVPTGTWQVVYQKDGYETARSAWLPVPPPQLDVNVALTQYTQPVLSAANAAETGIDLTFSLYMKTATVSALTVSVTQDGAPVSGTVQAVNGEQAFNDAGQMLASRFRFVPDKALKPGSKVTVKVSSLAKSYAGIAMGEDAVMELAVGRDITSIGSDSLVTVPYGGSRQLVVSVLPAQAAALKTVNIRMESQEIAGLETSSVILDSKGQAYVTVTGKLPGTAYMYFSLEGTDYSGVSVVHVESADRDVPDAPKASVAGGTGVAPGTQVVLTAQEGCTIWYTLDGSCPCDDASRIEYTGPVTIDSDMSLRAMAVAADGTESETVTFTWFVTAVKAPAYVPAADAVYDLNGRRYYDTPAGIYIRDGRKHLAR